MMKTLKYLLIALVILTSINTIKAQEYEEPIYCTTNIFTTGVCDLYDADIFDVSQRIRSILGNASYNNGTWTNELGGKLKLTKFSYSVGANTYNAVVVRPNNTDERPAVFVAPGGGFVDYDPAFINNMDEWAADLAMRGYVAVYYEYEVGWRNTDGDDMEYCTDSLDPTCFMSCLATSPDSIYGAMYRAWLSASVMGQTVISDADDYDIDVDMLFAGGHSASAFIANFLGSSFVMTNNPCALPAAPNQLGLKGIVSSSASIPKDPLYFDPYSFNCTGRPDTYQEWWTHSPRVPTLFFHGVTDPWIPYYTEAPTPSQYDDDDKLFKCPNQLVVDGSVNIADKLADEGIGSWTVLFCNLGHATTKFPSIFPIEPAILPLPPNSTLTDLRTRFDVSTDFINKIRTGVDISLPANGPSNPTNVEDDDNIFNNTINGNGSWTWESNEDQTGVACFPNFDLRLAGCGKAIEFDGTNDQVKIPHGGVFNVGNGPFTVEMQITTSSTKANMIMLTNNLTGNPFALDGLYVGLETGRIYVNIFTNFSTNKLLVDVDGDDLRDGQCHHVAVTRSSDQYLRLYVDGVEVENSPVGTNINMSYGNNFFLGNTNLGSSSLDYEGTIDELRIWEVQRSTQEIDNYKDSSALNTTVGLGGWWRFNYSIDGQTFADFGGSTRDAFLGNTASVEGVDASWEEFCCTISASKKGTTVNSPLQNPTNEASMMIYPNPVSSVLTVEFDRQVEEADIQIIDLTGRVVKAEQHNEVKTVNIDVSSISSGVYFISTNYNGTATTSKFVKQ